MNMVLYDQKFQLLHFYHVKHEGIFVRKIQRTTVQIAMLKLCYKNLNKVMYIKC